MIISVIKELIDEFKLFHGYLDICFTFEKSDEFEKLKLSCNSDDEIEKCRLKLYDTFISDNAEKFVNEFNLRLNKFNIMKYIKL